MPIYEFKCKECGKGFEQLCRINWEGSVKCPDCGAVKVNKMVSSVCSPGTGGSGSGCGGSCSSGCSGCK
ncbi:MAG: hypothetical protein H6Q74_1879 [Firmicutes bacterium]|nr:hypothetical protein [Bacillota bacterium]